MSVVGQHDGGLEMEGLHGSGLERNDLVVWMD